MAPESKGEKMYLDGQVGAEEEGQRCRCKCKCKRTDLYYMGGLEFDREACTRMAKTRNGRTSTCIRDVIMMRLEYMHAERASVAVERRRETNECEMSHLHLATRLCETSDICSLDRAHNSDDTQLE